jgi:hypothetical protein
MGACAGSRTPAASLRLGLPERCWAERRPVVLGAAAFLYAAVFALRARSGDIGLLYVVPIALVALELGLRAGPMAAGFAARCGRWPPAYDHRRSISNFEPRSNGLAETAAACLDLTRPRGPSCRSSLSNVP